jgi:hypothetical protein
MQNFSRSLPKTQQVCPMCHAQLPAGVLYCDACGTDLSRAGVLFSTSVRPVSRHSFRVGRQLRTIGLIAGVAAAVTLGLVGLGSIPQVSARVPAILTITAPIRGAFNQAMEWSSQLVGRDRPESPPATPSQTTPLPAPAPPAAVTPYLVVRSTPDAADVYVNGALVGKTPFTMRQVRSGMYTIKVAHKGYTSASRRVELKPNVGMTVTLPMKRSPAAAPKAPAPKTAPPQAAPAPSGSALAPGFTLKDRRGVIFRLSDFRGRHLTMLMVWELDGDTEQLIRALQDRSGGRDAIVLVIRPNRLALRRFIEADRITLPVLLANPEVAAEYRVPEGVAVLFLVNEQGRIQSRQIATKR